MNAQQQIIKKYGEPGIVYEQKYCALWDVKTDFPELARAFPHSVETNKDFKAKLFIAFTNLKAAGLLCQIITFNGCLEQRKTRGSHIDSLHSWALAWDLNSDTNQMQFHHEPSPFEHSTFTKSLVDIMLAAGLFWGGYYSERFDPMHFALYNG